MATAPLRWLTGLLLLGLALAAAAQQKPQAPRLGVNDFVLYPERDAGLMAQLSAADASWTPTVEQIPGVGTRYRVKRLAGAPPLSIAEMRQLLRNPPRFEQEQAAVRSLLQALRRSGVLVALGPPRLQGAAGEWDPRGKVLRIRPDVPSKGSRAFAHVLNHELIHVAQTCRGRRWFRQQPEPLGLAGTLSAAASRHLAEPLYARASAAQRALEAEAYANQDRLSLGPQLLAAHCD